jgi:hypothetical protein
LIFFLAKREHICATVFHVKKKYPFSYSLNRCNATASGATHGRTSINVSQMKIDMNKQDIHVYSDFDSTNQPISFTEPCIADVAAVKKI